MPSIYAKKKTNKKHIKTKFYVKIKYPIIDSCTLWFTTKIRRLNLLYFKHFTLNVGNTQSFIGSWKQCYAAQGCIVIASSRTVLLPRADIFWILPKFRGHALKQSKSTPSIVVVGQKAHESIIVYVIVAQYKAVVYFLVYIE